MTTGSALPARSVSLTLLRRHFEMFIDRTGDGQEFGVTRRGKPIALLAPFFREQHKPLAGSPADPGAMLSEPPP